MADSLSIMLGHATIRSSVLRDHKRVDKNKQKYYNTTVMVHEHLPSLEETNKPNVANGIPAGAGEVVADEPIFPTRSELHAATRPSRFGVARRAGVIVTGAALALTALSASQETTVQEVTPPVFTGNPLENLTPLHYDYSSQDQLDDNMSAGKARVELLNWMHSEEQKQLDPKGFSDGQFLGAFVQVFDVKDSTRRTKEVNDYYQSRGKKIPPTPKISAHRLIGSIGLADDNKLANGAVLQADSINSHTLFIQHHDITPIDAPISVQATLGDKEISGIRRDRRMGIAGVPTKQDRVYIVEPVESREGWVRVREYKLIGQTVLSIYKNIDGKMIKDKQAILEDAYLRPKGVNEDVDIIRTSMCWVPGFETQETNQRLISTFQEVDVTIERGSVKMAGDKNPTPLPHD